MSKIERPYNPENQALSVFEAQRLGLLTRTSQVYAEHSQVEQMGLNWIVIGDTWYLESNCDLETLNRLLPGDEITQLSDLSRVIVSELGEECHPVAALFSNYGPIYVSPGFNLGEINNSIK